MVSVVLLLLLTVMSFTAARIGMQQQRLAGTDLRTREVHEAAEAGLEYALTWLRDNTCNRGSCDPSVCTTNCFPGVPRVDADSGYSFTPTVSFTMQPGGFLLVQSTALANEDSDIRSVVQQIIRQTDLLTPTGRQAPPIVVDGCSAGHQGNPDIFPRPGGKAIVTLDPKGQSLGDCLDPGHFDFYLCENAYGNPVLCTSDGHDKDRIHDRSAYLADESANRPNTTRAAWDYMFEESFAEAVQKAIAANQVYASDNDLPAGDAPDVPYLIYNTSSPFTRNGDTIGTPEHPVIIIVPAVHDCPTFNGGSSIYGFIYFENETACLDQGWGQTEVYGSVIYEGDGNFFTANTNLFDQGNLDGGGSDDTTVFLDDVAKALGSWRDW